ncbi:MAG: FeoB-associated Cys-rich membrane protein [Sphaerochaeta sp.]
MINYIIVLAVVVFFATLLVKKVQRMRRIKAGKEFFSCSGGCSGCSGSCH